MEKPIEKIWNDGNLTKGAGVLLFVGVLGVRHFPLEVRFLIAAVIFFGLGHRFQNETLHEVRRFRLGLKFFLWLGASVCFWYSSLLWYWWAKSSVFFPLFLLNERLTISVYFEVTQVLGFWGIFLTSRDRQNSAASS